MSIYLPTIPTGLVNLDTDYQALQNNFRQLDISFGLNHIKFSVGPDNGKHTYVEMVNNVTIPAGLAANEVTLYTKTTSSVTDIFVTPDNSANEYQLTLSDSAHFASFGADINYSPPVTGQNGGWTFLPGGLLLQYGTSTSGIVVFPIAFKAASTPIVNVTPEDNSNGGFGIQSPITNTGFTVTASPSGLKYNWTAIGKQK